MRENVVISVPQLTDCTLVGNDGSLGSLGGDSEDDDGHAKDESAFEGDHDE